MLLLRRPVLACAGPLRLGAAIVAAITVAAATCFAEPPAVVSRPSVELVGDARARVRVRLDRAVEVTARAEPGRVIYRLHGARVTGIARSQRASLDDGPVRSVSLEPSGDDVEIVIEVRRPVDAGQRVVTEASGPELVVDVSDAPAARPAPRPRTPPPGAAPSIPPPSPAKPAPPPAKPAPRSMAAPPSIAAPPPSKTAPAALAPPAAPRDGDAGPRVLLGHRFIAPSRLDSAIVTSSVGVALDFALVSFDALAVNDGHGYRAYVAGLAPTIDLAVRVIPRFALLAGVGGVLQTGASTDSAVNLGAEGGVTWKVGAAGVVARLERVGTQVGAEVVVEGRSGGRIQSIEQLFDSSVSARKVPAPSALFDAGSSVTARLSWSGAQALGRHFSLQSAFGWAATRSVAAPPLAAHELDLTAGAAVTADAHPLFPLALQLEYAADVVLSQSAPPGGGPPGPASRTPGPAYLLADAGTHTFVAGLYYSGRADLQLGVRGGAERHLDPPPRTTALGRFEVRYFF